MELRLLGATYAEIARALGVSRQRCQQMLSPPRAVRNAVVMRARDRCETCGLVLAGGGHVHHRNTAGLTADDYGDLENLQLLCLGCHRRAHNPPHKPLRPGLPPLTVERRGFLRIAACGYCGHRWIQRKPLVPRYRCPNCFRLLPKENA